ncbi:MAG: TonB-dependent receptor [Saprospiraceae bacterium]|nr:TonB-dependent receptor [Saprospiraceae bacterium]
MKQILLLCFIFINYFSFSQNLKIEGNVNDESDNTPLIGVTVFAKTANKTVITNADGHFELSASGAETLVFSYVGYVTKTVSVNNQSTIDVKLTSTTNNIDQIVVVGSRSTGRVKTETPVPVDVVDTKQLTLPTARMDITSIINYAAPSFNANKQSGSDGADHIDLATLRGLGPDQSLVLINGKRRHQTAFVSVFGTRGRGNSGTDLNAIPAGAIERIEILRDGASAQYGSDAIAGVINLILKKNTKHVTGNIGWSGYHDTKFNPYFAKDQEQYVHSNSPIDGSTYVADMNYGFPIGIGNKDGFFNFTLNYANSSNTYRQVLDEFPTNPDGLPINSVRRAYGEGSLLNYGGFINMELPAKKITIYANGGLNRKNSDAYAYTRNFSARPNRFVTDASGNLIDVANIINTTKDGEKYFNPHINTIISDGSITAGVRNNATSGWTWDLSQTVGANDFHFYGDGTFNASTGNANLNHFDDGGFTFSQYTTNLNLSKKYETILHGLNLAFGAEYRAEKYKLYAGQEESYKNYGLIHSIDEILDTTGMIVGYDTTYKAGGAQGFPGYQPSDEVSATRNTIGGYVDVELDVTKKWLLNGAVRAENYSDFGFTLNYKLASRYKITDKFNLRGSVSTGFRAPSLQQINFSSTFTTVQGSQISEVKIAPNYSAITKAAGIPALKQERSTNASIGFTWQPISNFNITIDGYNVVIKDRVVLSGQFDATDSNLHPELIAALNDNNVALAQFFANAVNTTNKGIDLVLDYKLKLSKLSYIKFVLAGNLQKMTIDKVNVPDKLNGSDFLRKTFLSDREEYFIRASAPPSKFTFNAEYNADKLTLGVRLTRFGTVELLGYGEDGLGINPMVPTDNDPSVYVADKYIYSAKIVSDIYVGYKFSDKAKLFIGADNFMNVHPNYGVVNNARYWAFNTESGGPWDAVQMGTSGRRYFVRLAYNLY